MSTNMNISRELLTSVQNLCVSIKGQEITDRLIKELENESVALVNFFGITHFQSLVFSVYMEAKLKDRDLDLERMVEIFGKKLSMLADVNVALEELLAKKLVFHKTNDYSARSNNGSNKIICVKDMVANALMKGDRSLMENVKVDNFFALLSQIRDMIVRRIELTISTEDLCDEIAGLFEMNKVFPEIQWLLSFDDLNKYDFAILVNIAIEHIDGQEEVNIGKMIKEIFSEIQDRVRYTRKVKENQCMLFKRDLIINSDDDLSFANYVKLSDAAMDILLGGYKDLISKEVKLSVVKPM